MSDTTSNSNSSSKNRPTVAVVPPSASSSSNTTTTTDQQQQQQQQQASSQPPAPPRSTLTVTGGGNQLNASTSSSLLSSSSSSSSSSSNISNHSPTNAAAAAAAASSSSTTTSALHNLVLVEEIPTASTSSPSSAFSYSKSLSTGGTTTSSSNTSNSNIGGLQQLSSTSGIKMLSTSLNIPLSAASSHQNLTTNSSSNSSSTAQASSGGGGGSSQSGNTTTTLVPSISINTKHITNSSISLLTVSNKASSGVGSASIVKSNTPSASSGTGGGGSTPNTTTTSPTTAFPPSSLLTSNILSTNVYNNSSNNSSQNNLNSSFSSNQSQPGLSMSIGGGGGGGGGSSSAPSSESSPVSSGHGHFFAKKTFHKPTYCHHCTEMLWGLIGQGFVCEVCNFVCHEKCQKYVISVCSTKAHNLVKNPVAHCWSEPGLFKRKFCNVCRKRLEDNQSVRCEICDYHAHLDCQSLAVADCCETATYTPSLLQWLSTESGGTIATTTPTSTKAAAASSGVILHRHHWREGNLPSNSKCMVCKKTCWTSECLAGMRCEWCGLTTHSMCRQRVSEECNFGKLRDIIVPPYAISVPRVDINKAAILGIQSSSSTSSWSPGNGASGASIGGGGRQSSSGKMRSNSGEWSSGGDFKSENNSEFTVTPPPSISTNNANLNNSFNSNNMGSSLSSSVGNPANNNSSSNLTALTATQFGYNSNNNNSSSPSGSGSLPPSPFFSKDSTQQPTTGNNSNTLLPCATNTTNTSATVSSSSSSTSSKKKDKSKSAEDEEESREVIRVYDGNASFRKRMFKTITVPKNSAYRTIIEASLRTFHINDDPSKYYISIPFLVNSTTSSTSNQQQQQTATTSVMPNMDYSDYQLEERLVEEANPIKFIKTFLLNNRLENTKLSVMLRYKDELVDTVRIYLDASLDLHAYQLVKINLRTTVNECIHMAMERFDLITTTTTSGGVEHYFMMEVLVDQEVRKRVMNGDELPLQIIKLSRRESLCSNRIVRFYLHRREDQSSELSVPLFVGNLPTGLSQIQYEKILMESLLKNNNDCRWDRIDVYYYEYGSLVMLYEDAERAARAYKMLRDAYYENKQLTVLLLPTIQTPLIPPNVCPLLVFVNVKSGGQQGADLITSFRHLLNPHQVFDLQNCGPLPGLYVFRNIESYRILACGGDGTIGWVLSCLDNVSQDARCQSPPMAIVPIGTGNDLARVLRWGTGYTGGEDPIGLLSDVIDAEEITLDRWTVVFHSDENKEQEDLKKQQSIAVNPNQPNTNEDNTHIFVMNNYFGIGIDADVALDFHTAREGNPNKFNSRLNNKKYYLQMGIRKIMSKGREKIDFNRYVTVEVDGRRIDLPPIEGIIILNILSWGGGFNPWGSEKDDVFSKPNHYDGMLEVIGIRGILHIGQILSGMSNAIRLAQGGRIKIRMNTDIPIQVDGEPWLQSPCTITIIKSALKATMLKKSKIKIKRRNTEPNVNVPTTAVASSSNADSTGSSGGGGGGGGGGTTTNNNTNRLETTDPVVVVDQDGDSEPFQ